MSISDTNTITAAPYALPVALGDGTASSATGGVKEEVIANGSVTGGGAGATAVAPAAPKRKLDPAEEAKLREAEYKKRYRFTLVT